MLTQAIPQLNAALAGRYAIERELGRGGMATVYLARDLRHDRHVAVKVLDPELGAVLGAERFLSEIRVTAHLQHPNLLPLFDSGEAAGLVYYVMPYVDGESLRARLDRERQLPIDEAVRIATAIGSALAYAHEHGVIHRDLKPENILIQAGEPVLADFGIALAVSRAGGARVTQTGISLGTPQYMSPEQATGDRALDRRADIYSLGAVTYEMLTGEPPHSGSSAQAVIARLMTTEPQPVRVLRPSVPPHVAQAVEKALCKLPADRFDSAQEFVAALRNPHFTTASAPSAALVSPAALPWWRRAAAAAVAIAVLALVAAAWALRRPAAPAPVVRYVMQLDSGETMIDVYGRLALSPDGSHLIYNGGPQGSLVVRARDRLHSTLIAGTPGALTPFFSPDGETVGFFVDRRVLKLVSLRGGPPVTVTDTLVGAAGATWAPDGHLYVDGLGPAPLYRVEPRQGATPRRFTALDTAAGETDHTWPDALPSGRGILFTVTFLNVRHSAHSIAVADVSTGKHRLLVDGVFARYSPSGHLAYVTEDGTLMVAPFDERRMTLTGEPHAVASGLRVGIFQSADLAISRSGTLMYVTGATARARELVWVKRDGSAEPVDTSWRETIRDPALSPDGRQVVMTIGHSPFGDIWVKQLDRGPAIKITHESRLAGFPAWTADGKSVTYFADVGNGRDLFTQRADGSTQPRLQLHRDRQMAEALWSHDGQWLIYRTNAQAKGSGDILALRPGVDTASIPIATTAFNEFAPALSPDDRYLAYASNESGQAQVYVVPFPNAGAAKWAISTHGGSGPVWAHSGRELFYRDTADNMVSVSVTTRPTFVVGPPRVLFRAHSFATGVPHRQFDVALDDQRFLMLRLWNGDTPELLTVVENWFVELRRR